MNQKSIFRADRALSKFERLEYLWGLLRNHCHQVGRQRVLEKRKEIELERIRSLEAEKEIEAIELRRKSVRASVSGRIRANSRGDV